jgi:rhamnulokinase
VISKLFTEQFHQQQGITSASVSGMDHFYVAGDLGAENCRVMLGRLQKDRLAISEVRRFPNQPLKEKNSIHWNIPHLYQELLSGLRELSVYDEPIESVSCHSWAGDYLLFHEDGSLISPAFHRDDPRTENIANEIFSKIPWETIYEETGTHCLAANTLFQLATEKSRRLKKCQLLPIADGFNYLLSGVPRAEISLASATQLFNPVAINWSEPLIQGLRLPAELFPQTVSAGTKLGSLRPEVVKETKLEEAQVIASCSNELAAALFGLPLSGEAWAFLRVGPLVSIGTQLLRPLITDSSRDLGYTNELDGTGATNFYKQAMGLWVVDECKKFWKQKDRDLDNEMLEHLATAAPPFESLINLNDPRFLTPGDMPLKIQAFCKETNQEVPRRPGPILRCVLESLALHYRKTLQEIESLTGREFSRAYLIGGTSESLFCHFVANALQIPLTIAPPTAASIGNVIMQALALGHIKSPAEAREIVRNSFKFETITPHATVWNEAYDRLAELVPS